MKPLATLRGLKLPELSPAGFTSRCSRRTLTRSQSPFSPRPPQLLLIRSFHATDHHHLSAPEPQPEHELDQHPQREDSISDPTPDPVPSPTQTQAPLIYPSRATPPSHHDLPSFLTYAERTNLSPKGTVYVGTHYEYTVQAALASHGFRLQRVGGASDHGIDLLGTWTLPAPAPAPQPPPLPLRVIVQCKALAASPRPASVRELEGAFVGAPAGWRTGDGLPAGGGGGSVVGLLVAPGPSTKGVRDAVARSRWPMGFVCCARETGHVTQFLWNQAAVRQGLEGVGVAWRHDASGEEAPRLVLTWQGRPMGAAGGGKAGAGEVGG